MPEKKRFKEHDSKPLFNKFSEQMINHIGENKFINNQLLTSIFDGNNHTLNDEQLKEFLDVFFFTIAIQDPPYDENQANQLVTWLFDTILTDLEKYPLAWETLQSIVQQKIEHFLSSNKEKFEILDAFTGTHNPEQLNDYFIDCISFGIIPFAFSLNEVLNEMTENFNDNDLDLIIQLDSTQITNVTKMRQLLNEVIHPYMTSIAVLLDVAKQLMSNNQVNDKCIKELLNINFKSLADDKQNNTLEIWNKFLKNQNVDDDIKLLNDCISKKKHVVVQKIYNLLLELSEFDADLFKENSKLTTMQSLCQEYLKTNSKEVFQEQSASDAHDLTSTPVSEPAGDSSFVEVQSSDCLLKTSLEAQQKPNHQTSEAFATSPSTSENREPSQSAAPSIPEDKPSLPSSSSHTILGYNINDPKCLLKLMNGNELDPLKKELQVLIDNIEKGANRRTSGKNSEKLQMLQNIQDFLTQNNDGLINNNNFTKIRSHIIGIIGTVCHIKRHSLSWWTPHSVGEFKEKLNENQPLTPLSSQQKNILKSKAPDLESIKKILMPDPDIPSNQSKLGS